MRTFLIGFAAVVGAIYLSAVLFPAGEIVTLHTIDEAGRRHDSALWIVDTLEGPVLRAGGPDVLWLDRLILHPGVSLERGDTTRLYEAAPVEDAALRAAVNEAMARKYGLAESLVRRFRNVEEAIVVKLTPSANENGGPTDGH